MIRVCLSGFGRTGKEIAKVILEQDDMKLVSVICGPESDKKGKDIAEYLGGNPAGIIIEGAENLEQVVFRTKPDVVIDFSTPAASISNAKTFSKLKVDLVIGTTGFTKLSLNKLFLLTRKYKNGIIYAPNITLGVNVLMLLTNLTASIKVGENDKIEISHESYSRKAFAMGTLRAARYICRNSGYFKMNDVLDFKKVLLDYLKNEERSINKKYGGSSDLIQNRQKPLAL